MSELRFPTLASASRIFPPWRFRYAPVCVFTPDGQWAAGYAMEFASLITTRPPIVPVHWTLLGYVRGHGLRWLCTSRDPYSLWISGFDSRTAAAQFMAAVMLPDMAYEWLDYEAHEFARCWEAWRRLHRVA